MAKLTEYPAATQFDSGDILIKDGTNGTKKITVENAAADLVSKAVDTTLSQAGKAADAAAVGAEIGNLKSDLGSLAELSSENLIANATWTDGQYIRVNDGAAGNNDNWAATPYIPVKPNTTYTLIKAEYMQGCVYTDTVSTSKSNSFNPSTSINTFSVQTGENDRYIRLSCPITDKSIAGVYEIYCENPILKDNVEIPQLSAINTSLLERMNVVNTAANPTNYQTLLPDLNSVLTNTVYKMYFSLRSTDIPSNLPFARWITDNPVYLITFGVNVGSNAGIGQILIGDNFVFYRCYSTAWKDWQALRLEVNVGTGYQVQQHFTSLTEAVVFCTKYRNATLNVYAGTFNLYNEFISYYGADFFANYTVNTQPRGLMLTNNIHIKCHGNSTIVFNYTGDNQYVKSQFSPINFLSSCRDGFILENATVICSNCRYCVHDDPGDTSRGYVNKYINCHFEIDNSENNAWFSSKAIGGGLGRAGQITIDGCICVDLSPSTNGIIVSYHNDAYSDVGKSRVEIKNSYLYGGTIGALYDGSSTEKTDFVVTNNSIPSAVRHEANQASSTVDNIAVYDWNNVIRSS